MVACAHTVGVAIEREIWSSFCVTHDCPFLTISGSNVLSHFSVSRCFKINIAMIAFELFWWFQDARRTRAITLENTSTTILNNSAAIVSVRWTHLALRVGEKLRTVDTQHGSNSLTVLVQICEVNTICQQVAYSG